MKKIVIIIYVCFLFFAFSSNALCGEVKLTWGPSTGATGYYVYWGYESGKYVNRASTSGTTFTHEISITPPVIYYAVTAYNDFEESDYSNEVSYTNPETIINQLDSTFWILDNYGFMNINRNTGQIISNVTSDISDSFWHATWGRQLSIRKGEIYTISFSASVTEEMHIGLVIQKNGEWVPYSNVVEMTLSPGQTEYSMNIKSLGDDDDATLAVWTGYQQGQITFWNINVAVTKYITPLNYDSWVNTYGYKDWDTDEIIMNIDSLPANPWNAVWGYHLNANAGSIYVLNFEIDVADERELTVLLQQDYDPWHPLGDIIIANIGPGQKKYKIPLLCFDSDEMATIVVWCGHSTGQYVFSNISVYETHPLGSDYWLWAPDIDAHVDYELGEINFNVDVDLSATPWRAHWGRNLSVSNGQTYVVAFDIDVKTERTLSVMLQQNYPPYTKYSEIKKVTLVPGQSNYNIELLANATDTQTVAVVWVGASQGEYTFRKISINPK